MIKKILIITPKMPFPMTGACEQDRGYGIEDFIRLGYEIEVITKTSVRNINRAQIESRRLGISLTALPYVGTTWMRKGFLGILRRLVKPWTWDGAANEYYDPVIQDLTMKKLLEFKPDLVWFDYTYLWPLYTMIRENGIPIITRSVNFEPSHFLQEDGKTFVNLLKYIPKIMSEVVTARKSNIVLSITPHEKKIYARYGSSVMNLPLRGLPHLLVDDRVVAVKDVLDVFFFGSTYNVHHNLHALEFLLKEVFPGVEKRNPGKFKFHILGAKIPSDLQSLCRGSVVYEGYVPDLNEFLSNMDIAVIPSLMGAGMQQKIFEPLVRGIPLVTSRRGIADYPFVSPRDYIAANTSDEFIDAIILLQDVAKRRSLSMNSLDISKKIFSREIVDSIITSSIESIT